MNTKQIKFLGNLFAGVSFKASCKDCGVTERTGYKWLQDKEVKEELQSYKARVLETVSIEMQCALSEAVRVLIDIITDENIAPQVRVNAAGTLLTHNKILTEQVDIINRLEAVEDALREEREGELIEAIY